MSDEAKSPPAAAKDPSPGPRPWGDRLLRFDKLWTRVDTRLCTSVLLAQISLLAFWAVLNAMTRDHTKGSSSALVVRILVSIAAFGASSYVVGLVRDARDKKHDAKKWALHALVILLTLLLDYVAIRSWSAASSTKYAANLLTWIQNASVLTFLGGLRGLVTRLTLWVALLGASIATSNGKHINVDLVVRLLKPKMRVPAAIASSVAAILVCVGAIYAFVDSIAIAQFHAPATQPCPGVAQPSSQQCETPAGEKLAVMRTQLGKDAFLLGRQLSLDAMSFPRVISGEPYDKYMTPAMWNTWLRSADWTSYYPKEAVDGQLLDEKDTERRRSPVVNVPGAAEATFGLLLRELNFVFPFGLLMIALRFLVRLLLIVSGHRTVDPDAVHADEELIEHADGGHIAEKGGA